MTDPEIASETVTILASPELLAEMEAGWSDPVQVTVRRPSRPGDPWDMTIRRVPPTTTVYPLIPQGVRDRQPIGVFSTPERAEAARARAETYSDGYHELLIEPYEIDRWHFPGLNVLSTNHTQPGATPEWMTPPRAWLAHPTDPADVEQAWAGQ